MEVNIKFRKKLTLLLLLFISFYETVWSKCDIYLNEVHTPAIPFLNQIPDNYAAVSDFHPDFHKTFQNLKNHPNNYYEFQRYCRNSNGNDNARNYGFAVIDFHDYMEGKPLVYQYFKFNDSNFNDNGILLVGNVGTKILNPDIQIQKMSYSTFLVKDKENSRKYHVSQNYLFLIFEHSPATSWIDIHFEYGEKYISLSKFEKLVENSVDGLIIAEAYGVSWIKDAMHKLNVPIFEFEYSSSSWSWSRCCNNWFLAAPTIGTENACCSLDLHNLKYKGLPQTYREPGTCKVRGCLLREGKTVNITGIGEGKTMATVSKIEEKNVTFKFFKDGKQYDTVLTYEKLFSTNSHITVLNCTAEIPEMIDTDKFDDIQILNDSKNYRNEIIFCYFNETFKEKLCGKFWIDQTITVMDKNHVETLGTITNLYTNSTSFLAKAPFHVRMVPFKELKEQNSQNFEREACFLIPKNVTPTNLVNYDRSIGMSKFLQKGQQIFYASEVNDNKIKRATITEFLPIFAKIRDDESGHPDRVTYDKIIAENPSLFEKLQSDKGIELYHTVQNAKNISAFIKLNQSLNFNFNGSKIDGKIGKIFGDIGILQMNTTNSQENILIPIEDVQILNRDLFKEIPVEISQCSKFKAKQISKHHLHQRKKPDCN